MDDDLGKLGAVARAFSLNEGEKAAMRIRLETVISQPATRRGFVHNIAFSWREFFGAPFGRLAAARPILVTAAIAALLSGIGVSYAAEGAVPGDALYSVKIRFNEEVRAALTVGKLDKVAWEGERAARRIEEGEILIRRGGLDETARRDIIDGYLEHMEKAASRVEEIGAEDKPAAERVEARLQAQWERGRETIRKMESTRERLNRGEGGQKGGTWREPRAEDYPFDSSVRTRKTGGEKPSKGGD